MDLLPAPVVACCARSPPRGKTVARGKLVRIMRDQRAGFIAVEGGGADVFVHYSALAPGVFDTLKEGQVLEFDLEPDPQGREQRAVNVRLATG
jgi:cold shock protein